MRAAAIQFFATPFEIERNLETAERLVRQAAVQRAQLAVLPEVFNTGYAYSPRLTAAAEAADGPTVRWLQALSAELGLVLAGSLLLRERDQAYNCLVVAQPNGRLDRYAKRHPFLWEGCYFAAGREPVIVATELGRLGLLICWDLAQSSAWGAYAGQVDAVLIASAPARFHRAVVNFPRGRKVYLAQLMPALLRQKEALDALYGAHVGACATALGVPAVHAVMAGRFVAQLPLPRLSFASAAALQPRYWSWTAEAHRATVRATFYGTSAVYDAAGCALARVGESQPEGVAVAEVTPTAGPAAPRAVPPAHVPWQLRLFELGLRPLARRAYTRQRASTHAAQAVA